jgi:hypothetical protein
MFPSNECRGNNRETVGNGIFYAVRADVTYEGSDGQREEKPLSTGALKGIFTVRNSYQATST